MCGRYGFTSTHDVYDEFDIENELDELRESYNVAPSQEEPVIERHSPNKLYIRRWGYKPEWGNLFLINAKTESLTNRLWKKSFETSRCIVPANWFYEWKVLDDKSKVPYLIRLKKRKLFGFAGLTLTQKNKEGKEEQVFVIITTEPNSLMKNIHNRMPVILNKQDEDEWLNPDNVEPEKLLKMLNPYPANEMEAYVISSLVNSPKNNDPAMIRPFNN